MVDRGGQLEVEVNQARGLIPKPGCKNIPGTDFSCLLKLLFTCRRFITVHFCCFFAATYVKVYVLENGVCLAKKKTKAVKRNLDPTYQQALLFDESPQGKVLQVCFPFFHHILVSYNSQLQKYLHHSETYTHI